LRGDEDVGGRVEGRRLIAVDEVARVEMILFIEDPVDARDELVVELLIRDGIEDETAVVGILSRIDLGRRACSLSEAAL
jgi:hypothetical protein